MTAGPTGGSQTGAPLRDRAAERQVRRTVVRAGSSFRWAMAVLPRERRAAMYAIYAYCREVDDIADGTESPARKIAMLDAWRDEIGALYADRPTHPVTRALHRPVRLYALPRAEFDAVLDGMAHDAAAPQAAPALADLQRYCRQVAGAVGVLTLAVCGLQGPAATRLAIDQGEAMQMTNILRDLGEDAARDRLYLPEEYLSDAGIATRVPRSVLRDPGLPLATAALTDLAEARYATAEAAYRSLRDAGGDLRPARAMAAGYRRLLGRLRDGAGAHGRISLSRPEKVWLAVRYGLPHPW